MYVVCVCTRVCILGTHVMVTCGGQRRTFWSRFSPSTVCILGIEIELHSPSVEQVPLSTESCHQPQCVGVLEIAKRIDFKGSHDKI